MQVGPAVVLDWLKHYMLLGVYTLLNFLSKPFRGLLKGYRAQRMFEAWQWGSGKDHTYSPQGS
jgi:lycopene cyclase CruP